MRTRKSSFTLVVLVVGVITLYFYEQFSPAKKTTNLRSYQETRFELPKKNKPFHRNPAASSFEPNEPNRNHETGTTSHEHHENCKSHVIRAQQMEPHSLPPLTEEEVLESLLANQDSLKLLDEFESSVVLPDGRTVRRDLVAQEFEERINELLINEE